MSDNSVVRFFRGRQYEEIERVRREIFLQTPKPSKFFLEKSLKRKSLAASIGGQAIHVTLNYSAE